MRPYTTPTHDIVVEGKDLTGCDVWVSYQQGTRERDVKVEPEFDGTDTVLHVPWTQQQTAYFSPGCVEVQVNWVYPQGERWASKTAIIDVEKNLLSKEVEYGE